MRLVIASLLLLISYQSSGQDIQAFGQDLPFSVVVFHSPHNCQVTVHAYSCDPDVVFKYQAGSGTGPMTSLPKNNVCVDDVFYVIAKKDTITDRLQIWLDDGNNFSCSHTHPGMIQQGGYSVNDSNDFMYIFHPTSNTRQAAPYNGSVWMDFGSNCNGSGGFDSNIPPGYVSAWHNSAGVPIAGDTSGLDSIANGTYTATLINVPCIGESVTASFTIDPLFVSCVGTTPTCDGMFNGTATFHLTAGGQDNYDSWYYLHDSTFTLTDLGAWPVDVDFTDYSYQEVSATCTVGEVTAPSAFPLTVHLIGTQDCYSTASGGTVEGSATYYIDGGAPPYYLVWSYGYGGADCDNVTDTSGPINPGQAVTVPGCDAIICAYAYCTNPCVAENISETNGDAWIAHEFSESVTYTPKIRDAGLLISPLPAFDQVEITFPVAGSWQVLISDASGKIMDNLQTAPDTRRTSLNIDLLPGVFYVRAIHAATGQVLTTKLPVVYK